MAKQKNNDWNFSMRQSMWSAYVRGMGIKGLVQCLNKTVKSVESEIWKINVQYYESDDVSEVRAEHSRIEGPSLKGPITKREAKIIKIAKGYKQPVPLPVIARLLGRPIEDIKAFLHPGHKRASLFGR